MTKNINTAIAVSVCAVMLLVPALASAQIPQAASAVGLRIVVISGEDAVNIIQQKTAVNPIVEVRDRNDLPVSGVAITFNLGGGGGASFAGGASTLTVTTNAAGQAVVTGLTPTATGAVTINATAVVNGQTIAATITQTNFATAAEAASAASSAGGASGGGTSGAAGGGGGGIGGMSGMTAWHRGRRHRRCGRPGGHAGGRRWELPRRIDRNVRQHRHRHRGRANDTGPNDAGAGGADLANLQRAGQRKRRVHVDEHLRGLAISDLQRHVCENRNAPIRPHDPVDWNRDRNGPDGVVRDEHHLHQVLRRNDHPVARIGGRCRHRPPASSHRHGQPVSVSRKTRT